MTEETGAGAGAERGNGAKRPASHRIGPEPKWTRYTTDDVRALYPLADLLMAAAWSDGHLDALERDHARGVLMELINAPLPLALEVRIADFDPEKFDLVSTVRAFDHMTARERRRLVAMAREVCDANHSFDLAEDRFIEALVVALALADDDVRGLVLRVAPYLESTLKRAFDVAFSLAALAALWPLLLAIGLAVRATSKGPALFRQRRAGRGGVPIEVWKFRTMRVQEDGEKVTQARQGDPRITPLGRFLRRTSLDELPQFVNVLRGEMSVVGPRPHALAHNTHYRTQILEYMLRHKVRPGITGWAQVNGWRGETETLDKMIGRVEHDLAYVTRGSFAMDLRCVWQTVFGARARANAY
jgi:putative colanic acid biosynthesis UDP-glucose lipid carrier transferase